MSKLDTIKCIEWENAIFGRLVSVGGVHIVTGKENFPKLGPDKPASYMILRSYHLWSHCAAGRIFQWLVEGK